MLVELFVEATNVSVVSLEESMSLSALLTARNIPVIEWKWDSNTIDCSNVLLHEDKMYLNN